MKKILALVILAGITASCSKEKPKTEGSEFPAELVNFESYKSNPVFAGTGDSTTWDEKIRERGYIIREDSTYYMWYTGYKNSTGKQMKYLGLATSNDGIDWKRFGKNPIHTSLWIEDMFVLKSDSLYYMFAESKDDVAHLLTSSDKITWKDAGALDIRLKNGNPIEKGPFGTPVAWKEGDEWYLFYERNDAAVWLATSKDLKIWRNVQDEPVLDAGPEKYDQFAVAMNQIVKYNGLYYAYYHASAFKDWREWTMNVAVSSDLVHWEKYKNNPILGDNKSSGFLVHDGSKYRFYTMHPDVNLHVAKAPKAIEMSAEAAK